MQFDQFTVSTGPLRDQILKLKTDARVTVVRNGLSQRFIDSFDMCRRKAEGGSKGAFRIVSYLSGTASHNRDFESVAGVLAEFLELRRDFRLVVAGPLELPDGFPKDSLIRLPHREYRDFFASAGMAHFNIAPLKPGNVFNECKSGLKFFESGIWGVPSVVSPLEDVARFKDSPGIAVVESPDEWLAAMLRYADDEQRAHATENLDVYCREKCMAREQVQRLMSIVTGGAS
jgi:hypothetical protein